MQGTGCLDILPVLTQEINKRTPEHMAQSLACETGKLVISCVRKPQRGKTAQYVREVPAGKMKHMGGTELLRGAEDPSMHPGHTSFVSTASFFQNERCFLRAQTLKMNPGFMQEMADPPGP